MIKIRLYWHRETEDLDLGEAYLDLLPPIGSLIAFPTPAHPNVVWRIETIYIHPAHEGSASVRDMELGRRRGRIGGYDAFVIPTEGPFHP